MILDLIFIYFESIRCQLCVSQYLLVVDVNDDYGEEEYIELIEFNYGVIFIVFIFMLFDEFIFLFLFGYLNFNICILKRKVLFGDFIFSLICKNFE